MTPFKRIVVFHPGAIGDVTLATPVAGALKAAFPGSQLIYWTHRSLGDLLGLCRSIDRVVGYDREKGVWQLRRELAGMGADLVVDLAGSPRSRWLTFMSRVKVVRYAKQAAEVVPVQHAVENFLATLAPLGIKAPDKLFPTLSVPDETLESVRRQIGAGAPDGRALVGLVPGVGRLRPHRAWIEEGWVYAARILLRSGRYTPVLIGGEDETGLCEEISSQVAAVADGCLNAAGRLSLAETAAVCKLCRVVVSGDTGPAHICVAAGTPVVGLYGPTLPERSGPYGCEALTIDESHHCRCRQSKICTVPGITGPGECMRRISLEEVFVKLRLALADEAL